MLYMLLYIRVFDFLLTPWPQLFWYSRTRSKPWKNAKLHKMYGVLAITPNDPKFLTQLYTPSLERNIFTTIQPIHLIIGTHIVRDKGFPTSPKSYKSNHRKLELLTSKVRVKNKLSNQFRPIRSSNFTAPQVTWHRSGTGTPSNDHY